MTSAWWLLVAFVGGGWAGVLIMALMRMAGDLPEQSDICPPRGPEEEHAQRSLSLKLLPSVRRTL